MRLPILPLWDALAFEAEQTRRSAYPTVNRTLYDQCAMDGALISIGIRAQARLVGFWLAFLSAHPHHEGKLACAADLVYIKPEHRGTWAIVRALRLLRETAKAKGAHVLYANSPIGRDMGPIYRRFGLAPIEVQHSVWL